MVVVVVVVMVQKKRKRVVMCKSFHLDVSNEEKTRETEDQKNFLTRQI